jgi:phage anti-repressor protein
VDARVETNTHTSQVISESNQVSEMNTNLIPVFESTINEEAVQTVNARELHSFLESKQHFADWIKSRIEKYGFTQGVDFTAIHNSMTSPPTIDYHISLDMAKEVAMVERNEKGKQARQYFIAIEKSYRESQSHQTLSPAELILRQAQMLVDHERRVAEIEDRVKRVECKQQAFEDGVRYFTVIGYVGYKGLPSVNMSQAQKLGKLAKKLSIERGISVDRVKDQRHGYVGAYHESILDDVYAELLETE